MEQILTVDVEDDFALTDAQHALLTDPSVILNAAYNVWGFSLVKHSDAHNEVKAQALGELFKALQNAFDIDTSVARRRTSDDVLAEDAKITNADIVTLDPLWDNW